MIRHLVSWKMKDAPDVETRAEEIRRGLEGLAGQIDGLIEAHVYRGQGSNGYTLLLDSLLRDEAALAFYQDSISEVVDNCASGPSMSVSGVRSSWLTCV